MDLSKLKRDLKNHADRKQAEMLKRFFKTGPGEYAQDDLFLGLKAPVLRALAKEYQGLEFGQVLELLKSPIHEERLLALLIFILKYRKGSLAEKEKIYQAYIKYCRYINNWDLVDVTARHIVGDYLQNSDKRALYKLANSDSLWKRRIAILSTFHFIGNNDFKDALKIAEILITDRQDLIQKALGWMLREIGKRSLATEEAFLRKYCRVMPRTMLRYAIERFPENKRQAYLRVFSKSR